MLRKDGLPLPVTAAELYLAAILDELRGQKTVPSASSEERVKEVPKGPENRTTSRQHG